MSDAASFNKNQFIDCYEPITLAIDEKSNVVDGQYILARIKGRFFVPEGKSRNGRYYSSRLWEKVINSERVQHKLKTRTMYGTISHEQEINDKALLDGKISHIVVNLDPKTGMGEALVLNTPAGQVLNTLARAGCQLYVSSRGYGKYAGKTSEGLDIVDENTYALETFDFVIEPGFLEANPNLVEKLEVKKSLKGDTMSDFNLDLTKDFERLVEEKEALEEELAKYRKLGTPEEIQRLTVIAEDLLQKTKKQAAPCNEDLNKGSLASDMLEVYEHAAKAYIDSVGTLEDLARLEQAVLGFFEAYGNPNEIAEALAVAQDLAQKVEKLEEKLKAKTIADNYGIPYEKARKLRNVDQDVLEDIVNTRRGYEFAAKYRKGESVVLENIDNDAPFAKPRVVRLLESLMPSSAHSRDEVKSLAQETPTQIM